MRRHGFAVYMSTVVCLLAANAWGQAAPLGALAKMPVKEITVFKDGHALVVHGGQMPTDASGAVLLDYLPSPVLGTFWPYSSDPKVKLTGVTSSQRRVLVDHTALTIPELVEANPGVEVTIKETPELATPTPGAAAPAGAVYEATIIGIAQRSVEELETTSPPDAAPKLPQKGTLLFVKTPGGTRTVELSRIATLTFKNDYKKKVGTEELRNLLTLQMQYPDDKRQATADVGLMYLQKGIRWIPNYRIDIDGSGKAKVELQATLINELTDLKDVTANLVVGVPTFAFAGQNDPMGPQAGAGVQQAAAQLSQYFRSDASTAYALSNSIMSQVASPGAGRGSSPAQGAPATVDLGPEIGGTQKNEDLFVFTVKHLTLKKGERMVVPVAQYELSYKDIYALDIPFSPPPEVWRNFNSNQQSELARLYAQPKVMHLLRITNKSDYPVTTATALILRDGKVLAQAMTQYTPVGGQVDLSLTASVDVAVTKTDRQTGLTPNAATFDGNSYSRLDLAGTITIRNRRATPIDLEITRNVMGTIDKADSDGKITMLNQFEDRSFMPASYDSSYPSWWSWYSWPYWWSHFNSVGAIKWNATLQPEKDTTVTYTWHYYWR